jgi:hypothetical protein
MLPVRILSGLEERLNDAMSEIVNAMTELHEIRKMYGNGTGVTRDALNHLVDAYHLLRGEYDVVQQTK